MSISQQERISHVVRRLSMGVHPDIVAGLDSTDAAIARALDLSVGAAPVPPAMAAPTSYDQQRSIEIVPTIAWWIDQMRTNPRLIEERLVWFWQDHFATSIAKVRVPYLVHQQHAMIRTHATGSFADLLHAVAKDPAMLVYLDGISNETDKVNENFGRECLELFTLGIGGGYKQQDVVEASRSFTGWVVNVPGRRFSPQLSALGAGPWQSIFIAQRHDSGEKELLGQSGAFDLDTALDVILEHPSTGRFIALKLYRELVGLDADDQTVERLGDAFARDWSIMGLVEAITAEPAFTSKAAVRARVRTPVEKLVGIAQAGGVSQLDIGAIRRRAQDTNGVGEALRTIGFIPFVPPNVGGFPEGTLLLGPHQLVHTFDLLNVLPAAPTELAEVDDLLARFGIFDVEPPTRRVLERETDPGRQFALAALSPEFAVT
ncbi:MAG: DUF1800 family protein [Acidimicrobiia bacterium]|nr:DUF1800 family protein [Acidimicrobiia bacterium]